MVTKMVRVTTLQDWAAGEARKRWVRLVLGPDPWGEDVEALVCVIVGRRAGPTLYVGGGLHGDEYNGMETVRTIADQIDPLDLSGIVIAVPIQNPVAFRQQQRTLAAQLQDSDMNRVFPGAPKGSFGARLAGRLYSELVLQSSFVVDLHSASTGDSYIPLAYLPSDGPILEESRKLVTAFAPTVWVEAPVSGSLVGAAGVDGKPGIIVELGSGGAVEKKWIEAGRSGVLRVLGSLGMLNGVPEAETRPLRVDGLQPVRTEEGGFFHLKVQLGDVVSEGDVLADVVRLAAGCEVLTAPVDALVARIATRGVVAGGDKVVLLAPLANKGDRNPLQSAAP